MLGIVAFLPHRILSESLICFDKLEYILQKDQVLNNNNFMATCDETVPSFYQENLLHIIIVGGQPWRHFCQSPDIFISIILNKKLKSHRKLYFEAHVWEISKSDKRIFYTSYCLIKPPVFKIITPPFQAKIFRFWKHA